MKVPFADLRALHAPLKADLMAVFERVLDNNSFILGPEVQKFETAFAAFVGVQHCIAVNSGTAALQLALEALGIGEGDEVITVANTFFATAEAISAVGATPVFVDVDPIYYNMDPKLFAKAITPKTRAVIPVHLYGQTADMDPILDIAKKHNLYVIEDACQAHGAEYKGRKAGSMGIMGCFSFYPGKNLGALGEGGAIVCSDAGSHPEAKDAARARFGEEVRARFSRLQLSVGRTAGWLPGGETADIGAGQRASTSGCPDLRRTAGGLRRGSAGGSTGCKAGVPSLRR